MFLSYANCTCLPWIKCISAHRNMFLFPSLCYDLLMPCFSHGAAELVCKQPSQKSPSGNTLMQPSPDSLTEMYRTCPCQHLRGGLIWEIFAIISIGFIGKLWIRAPNAESLESVNSGTLFRQLTAAYSPGGLEGLHPLVLYSSRYFFTSYYTVRWKLGVFTVSFLSLNVIITQKFNWSSERKSAGTLMYQEFEMENIRYLYLGTCPWEAASVNHPLYI